MIRSVSALAGLFLIATVFADTTPAPVLPVVLSEAPKSFTVATSAPPVSAPSYVVFDVATGEVLVEMDPRTKRPIASVTKLMTGDVHLGSGRALDQSVRITATDVATEGRAGSLRVGEIYKTRELLFPLLLESSNDAATALTRARDSVLISQMQERLSAFGITITDASGLSEQNQASAEALAQYLAEVYKTQPHLFDITRLTQYLGTDKGWRNNSPVANLPGYRGGKHGYTEAAGRTLAAVFTEEITGENRAIGYILLGSNNLREDVIVLRDFVVNQVSYQ